MTIDVYDSSGKKTGTIELPPALFEAPIRQGLMHLLLMRQQSNRRKHTVHVKSRGEVRGSTRKLYRQKGTGRARRGPIRSPLLRGGGKTFGPRKERSFWKNLPKTARHSALRSCLSYRARSGGIIALQGYGDDHHTKVFVALLQKLPLSIGRRIVVVLPRRMEALERGARNVPRVKTLLASYLNPEDVLGAHTLIFLVDALKVAEEVFGDLKSASTHLPSQ
jgi:large subunit ribosomal protein L4